MASARNVDQDGFMTINDNPISKVGVFPYLGKDIPGAPEPDKIYMVLRPAEELGAKECIDSFKLQPWVDEHTMLGDTEPGLTPAEEKGVHGVMGEEIYFDGKYLRANLKIFSKSLRDTINSGKKELSCGYRCKYKHSPGVFDGESYDYIQYNIRGNHLASVEEGRMGHDVAVMDMKFTFDSKDLIMPLEDKHSGEQQTTSLDAGVKSEIMDMMKDAMPKMMEDAMKPLMEKMAKDVMYEKEKEKDSEGTDQEEEPSKKDDKKEESSGMDSSIVTELTSQVKALSDQIAEMKKVPVMDSKAFISEMNQRDDLVNRVSPFIGAFDHAEMTLPEVEKYACEKLGLNATAGAEGAVLSGYLHGRQVPKSYPTHSMDSASDAVNPIDSYLNGDQK